MNKACPGGLKERVFRRGTAVSRFVSTYLYNTYIPVARCSYLLNELGLILHLNLKLLSVSYLSQALGVVSALGIVAGEEVRETGLGRGRN